MSDEYIVFCDFAVLEGDGLIMVFEFDRGHHDGVVARSKSGPSRSRKLRLHSHSLTPFISERLH